MPSVNDKNKTDTIVSKPIGLKKDKCRMGKSILKEVSSKLKKRWENDKITAN